MSMPGARLGRAEASVLALAHAAHARRRAGRLDAALEFARQAAQQARALIDDGEVQWLPHWAEAVALECGIAIDCGRFDSVLARLDAALSELSKDGAAAAEPVRLAASRLHLEAGRVHAMHAQPQPARERLLAALAAPDLHTMEGEPGAMIRVRAEAALGATLCMHAEHAEGVQRLEQALAEAERLGPDRAGLERARILINLGAAHFEQQRLDEALRRVTQARLALEPLVHRRRAGARADLGRAWINLGGIHSRAGRMAQAVSAYATALDELDRALRSGARAGDPARLRATRAKAAMNLGYTLFKAGDFDAAQRQLAAALRRYQPLLQQYPHLRADVARTQVNAAHLAAQRGQHERSAVMYTRALKDFASMTAGQAAPHLDSDRANAQLGLARVELLRGHTRRSASLFDVAMATLRGLTHEGRLHHANAWLKAWVAQASTLLESATPAAASPPLAVYVVTSLLRAVRLPPLQALGANEEPLRVLAAALDAIERWAASVWHPAGVGHDMVEALCEAGLLYLLDCTAQVLADSAPAWLAERQRLMQQWVARLGEAAAARPGAALLLAHWLLRTRGLRAQRVALAGGADVRLAALRGALQELNRIETDLLGAARLHSDEDDHAGEAAQTELLAMGTDDTPAAIVDQHAARWQTLREQIDRRIEGAIHAGLLPPAQRLDPQSLLQRLAPQQALLFVARLDATRLVAVALRGDAAVRHRVVTSPAPHVRCDVLNAAARQALQHDFGAAPARAAACAAPRRIDLGAVDVSAPGDRPALAALRAIGDHAVLPSLDELIDAGVTEVAIVAADDLHVLPWGDLVRGWASRAADISVYPSAGAWLRSRAPVAQQAGARPEWTIACAEGPPDARWLRWGELERQLSQGLWLQSGAVVQPLASPAAARGAAGALLVIGHAEVPQGNPALAGLRRDDGSVLGAHEVAACGGFASVLLSACVLGRTDDAFGEPLGFLAACFSYHTHFGVGWLTEVPDDAACMFSLALQFALRAAGGPAAPAARWRESFHATCRAIDSRAWPEGFSDWFAGVASADAAAFGATPSVALRRVLPWVVALGG